jgi:carboxypeptidase C (cathepsin A)
VIGESYAGKYIPAIAERIIIENKKSKKLKIDLKGIGLGDPYTDRKK